MFSTEEFIIAVYCCVDDEWKQLPGARPIHCRRGFQPAVSDALGHHNGERWGIP